MGLATARNLGKWVAQVALRLAGRFNVHNALAAVALGEGLGLDPAAVRAGIEGLAGVPGRMERVERSLASSNRLRATCWVIVLPPAMVSPPCRSIHNERKMPRRSTPGLV